MYRVHYYVLLLVGYFLLFSIQTQGQSSYQWRQYSLEEGLPQSEVWFFTLFEDDRGAIWCGTNGGGLARLEGERFQTLNSSDGLAGNQVWHTYLDDEGIIWAVSFDKGISTYDGKTFKTYQDDQDYFKSGLGTFMRLRKDRWGRMWFVNNTPKDGGRLLVKEPEDDEFKLFNPEDSTFYTKHIPFDLFAKKDGSLWVCTFNGVFEITENGLDSVAFPKSPLTEGKNIRPRYETSDGKLWCSTNAADLLILEADSFRTTDLPDGFTAAFLVDMLEDQKGQMWFNYIRTGVLRFKNKEDYELFTDEEVPSISNCIALIEDREGSIWVGTRGAGVYRFTESAFTTYDSKDGLTEDITFTIYEDKSGQMWFGSGNAGISLMDSAGNIAVPEGINNANLVRVGGFFEEPEGTMLLGSSNGLFRYDGEKMQDVSTEFGLRQPAYIANITEIDNEVWISTFGQGVVRYDPATKTRQTYNQQNGLRGNNVNEVVKAKSGEYWIATSFGLSKLKNGEINTYGQEAGLKGGLALDIALDKNGTPWVLIFDGGLARWDGDQFTNFGRKDGLASDLLYSILSDKDGNIWLGTQNGINKLTIGAQSQIENIQHFSPENGFAGTEMNGRASFEDSKGNLWFGHIDGVSKIATQTSIKDTVPPITKITAVNLGLEPTNWQDSTLRQNYQELAPWSGLPKGLKLEPEQDHIVINFATSSHRVPSRVRYQWRLLGIENDWQAETDLTQASYPALPSGDYTFEVRSHTGNGLWGEPDSYSFTIKRPFWETPLFMTSCVLILAVLIYLAVRYRIRQVERQKEQLELLVAERTREVREQNEQILHKNEELQLQQIEIETQNRNIRDSITYAKRIQDAMLPLEAKMQESFQEHFVFYRPRDIVSGDFYWFSRHEENKRFLILSAIDCTGHGVPGAFMSMVANNLLHNLVYSDCIRTPENVLKELHYRLHRFLKQEKTQNRDGMDMSLITYNKEKRELRFAGAKNPMVLIRNGELILVKGGRAPIGGHSKRYGLRTYPETVFTFQENEEVRVYLFSDGFQDQFGGQEGRKFQSLRFRNLLLKIHQSPMKKQKEILAKTFDEWRGAQRQIDDVLVLGARLN